MIPVTIDSSEISGELEASEMALHLTPQLFRMISTSIYSCRERAIIQELVANCLDACKAIDTSAAIEITLPTVASPQLTVLDHGSGMDVDTLMNSALAYGNSTKSLDNLAVGGFGIGLKSVFSVSDTVTITTVHQGMKHVALGMMVNGRPLCKLLRSEPTEESSGTAVVIAVPEEYFDPMAQIAETSFTHWTHDVKVNGKLVNTKPMYLSKDNPVFIEPNQGWESKIRVMIGGFMLDVDVNRSSLDFTAYQRFMRQTRHSYFNAVIYADIGQLEIAPSRERIEYTASNFKILQGILDSHQAAFNAENLEARKRILMHYAEHRELFTNNPCIAKIPLYQRAAIKAQAALAGCTAEPSSLFATLRPTGRHMIAGCWIYALATESSIKTSPTINSAMYREIDRVYSTSGTNAAVSFSLSSKTRRASSRELSASGFARRWGNPDTAFVVTQLTRSQVTRIFNTLSSTYIDGVGASGSTHVSDIVTVSPESLPMLKQLRDLVSPLIQHDIQIVETDVFLPLWKDIMQTAAASRKAPSQSATVPSTAPTPRVPAVKPDVTAQSVVITPQNGIRTRLVTIADDVNFYQTIEDHVPVCPETGKLNLLIIDKAEDIGSTTSLSFGTMIEGTMGISAFGSITCLHAPTKSQLESARATKAIEALLAQNPDCVVHIGEILTKVLMKHIPIEWFNAHVWVRSIASMWSYNAKREMTRSDYIRQIPCEAARRTLCGMTDQEVEDMSSSNPPNMERLVINFDTPLLRAVTYMRMWQSSWARPTYESADLRKLVNFVDTIQYVDMLSNYGFNKLHLFRELRVGLRGRLETIRASQDTTPT